MGDVDGDGRGDFTEGELFELHKELGVSGSKPQLGGLEQVTSSL